MQDTSKFISLKHFLKNLYSILPIDGEALNNGKTINNKKTTLNFLYTYNLKHTVQFFS